MPRYDYECAACGVFEVRHAMGERCEVCPGCNMPVRRRPTPTPFLLTGSGFYLTDSRTAPSQT